MNTSRKPKVVCLCGSTRFYKEFMRAAYDCELRGEITVGPAFTPDVGPDDHGGTVGITPAQKEAVDVAFHYKIGMADEVLVINVGGYVGESTRKDILFARVIGKRIRYLESEPALPGTPAVVAQGRPPIQKSDALAIGPSR